MPGTTPTSPLELPAPGLAHGSPTPAEFLHFIQKNTLQTGGKASSPTPQSWAIGWKSHSFLQAPRGVLEPSQHLKKMPVSKSH